MAAKPETRRIDTTTSRTAEWTCMSRAASSFETDPCYQSGDRLAARLAPGFLAALLRLRAIRTLFRRCLAPKGMYEYVIARTKYVDATFAGALAERFRQIVLMGAGFDTRALRFQAELAATRVFELDAPLTQTAKLGRYRQRGLSLPPNLAFIPIDFEKESIAGKLRESGFRERDRSLFIFEGVLMYLLPESVEAAFNTLRELASPDSRLVFDYVRASVLRGENTPYGAAGAVEAVSRLNEQWRFGLEPQQVGPYLSARGFILEDHKDAQALEALYFTDPHGLNVARINGAHGLVTARRSP
jgi:methyltransferase (TIGR00027 family)